jgi:hypothetical protein
MRRTALHLLPVFALPVAAALATPACSSSATQSMATSVSSSSSSGGGAGGTGATTGTSGATSDTGGTGGAGPDPTQICKDLMLTARPFAQGPYGKHRGEVADDFTVDLADGTTFHLKERFSGCESYVFTPDVLAVSELDPTSIWESKTDLRNLVKQSPRNVHYFFVSRKKTDEEALPVIEAMQARVDGVLAGLPAADAAHWKERLHVVAKKAADLGGWLTDVLGTHGRIGFSIDRRQTIRGAGYLADVNRFDSALDAQMKWPWKWNLAYLANDPKYFNADADVRDRLDAEGATVVDLWKGETLMELADQTVTLPSAAEMANFDTLEIEVTQQCPNPDEIEIGNCGAWDYLAQLYLADDPSNLVEIARFITSYHRETHWVVDVSDMLPLLASGGQHAFRWSFAPSWNTQPTATRLSLRLSNQKKAARAKAATYLFSGGSFDSMYNVGRTPVEVPIPATAKKVELFVIVTGHGAEASQCSEFCNHQHEFTVNGNKHLRDFPMAGTQDKCVPNLEKGMTPNQAGTWWFGRGGWCPGQQVEPWVVDVTAEVTPGETATVAYRGLFAGVDPPPDGAGEINLVSYLVVHE